MFAAEKRLFVVEVDTAELLWSWLNLLAQRSAGAPLLATYLFGDSKVVRIFR